MNNNIITIKSSLSGSTNVSNTFIDLYMPLASDSYVKVYIFALRLCQGNADIHNHTIAYIAEALELTERSVINALKYWKETGIIALEFNAQSKITSIEFLNPSLANTDSDSHLHVGAESTLLQPDIKDLSTNTQPDVKELNTDSNNGSENNADIKPASQPAITDRPFYSDSQINDLTKDTDVRSVIETFQNTITRQMTSSDTQLMLYLYEDKGLPVDLIKFLYSYCAERKKTDYAYINAVAVAWLKEGVCTLEQAKANINSHSNAYLSVAKALGLDGFPQPAVMELIDKWLKEYGFTIEMIIKICNLSVKSAGRRGPSPNYVDKKMTAMYNSGVKSSSDIDEYEKNHSFEHSGSSSGLKYGQLKYNSWEKPVNETVLKSDEEKMLARTQKKIDQIINKESTP